MKLINKVCGCGKVYSELPKDAQPWIDVDDKGEKYLMGWFWDCSCKSTLFYKMRF